MKRTWLFYVYLIAKALSEVIVWKPNGLGLEKDYTPNSPISYTYEQGNANNVYSIIVDSNNQKILKMPQAQFEDNDLQKITKAAKIGNYYFACGKRKVYYASGKTVKVGQTFNTDIACHQEGTENYLFVGITHNMSILYFDQNKELRDFTSLNTGILLDWTRLSFSNNHQMYGILSRSSFDQRLNMLFYGYSVGQGKIHSEGTGYFNSGVEVFENVKVTKIQQDDPPYHKGDKIAVFSYNNNNYTGFLAQFQEDKKEEMEILRYFDSFRLPFFIGAKFLDFRFFRETGFFYYRIQLNGHQYIGAGDIEYGLILYNIQADEATFVSEGDIVSEDNHFLFYGNGTKVYRVCPFIFSNGKCKFLSHKASEKMKIDHTTSNSEVNSCTKNALGRYCLEDCPIGWGNGDSCEECEGFYDMEEKKCVSSCTGKFTDKDRKLCYNCDTIGKKKLGDICVDNCQDHKAIEVDGECHFCNEYKQYYLDGKCVDDCTVSKKVGKEDGICHGCEEYSQFFYEGKCIDNCGEHKQIGIEGVCHNCNEYKKYFYNNECVDDCTEFERIPEEDGVCHECKENNTFFLEGKCVGDCTVSKKVGKEDGICHGCEEYKQFFYEGKCIDNCEEHKQIGIEGVCHNCNEFNKYFYNNECVDDCTEFERIPEEDGVCHECKENNTFFFEGKCVGRCSAEYGGNVKGREGICVKCIEQKGTEFSYEGNCLESCEDHQPYITDTKVCYNCEKGEFEEKNVCVKTCKENSQKISEVTHPYCKHCRDYGEFYQDGKCQKECNHYQVYDEDNRCYSCKTINKKFEEGKCVDKCSEGYGKNLTRPYICEHCYPRLSYKETCLDEKKCPDYTAYEEKNHACIDCFEKYNKSIEYPANKCVETCRKGTQVFDLDHICKYCKDLGLYLNKGSCESSCSPHYMNETVDNTCYECPPKKIFFNYNCVDKCSEGYLPHVAEGESVQYCETCKNINESTPYYYHGKCIDKCPIETFSDNYICRNCYCSGIQGNCEPNSQSPRGYNCKCTSDDYIGEFCEIEHKKNPHLNIISLNEYIISTKESWFGFEFTSEEPKNKSLRALALSDNNGGYKLEWSVEIEDEQTKIKEPITIEKNPDVFINGVNEEILKLNRFLFEGKNKKNNIHLTLTDLFTNKTYTDTLSVKVKSIPIGVYYVTMTIDKTGPEKNNSYYPMDSNITIEVNTKSEPSSDNSEKLKYKYFYRDKNDEIFTLTPFIDSNIFKTKLPWAKEIFVELQNDRHEQLFLSASVECLDVEYEKRVDEILNTTEKDNEKLHELKTYLTAKSRKHSLEEEEFSNFVEYINKALMEEIKYQEENGTETENKKAFMDTDKSYIEPNEHLSLLNMLSHFIKEESVTGNGPDLFTEENVLKLAKVIEAPLKHIDQYITKNNKTKISNETYVSAFRTLDQLVNITTKLNFKRENVTEDNDIFKTINSSAHHFKNAISFSMSPGEQIKIAGKKIKIFIDQPGKEQGTFAVDRINTEDIDFNNYSNYIYKHNLKKRNCTNDTIFCIGPDDFDNLFNEFNLLKEDNLTRFTFSLIQIETESKIGIKPLEKKEENSDGKIPRTVFSQGSMSFDLYFQDNRTSLASFSRSLKYDIVLDVDKKQLKKLKATNDTEKDFNATDIACVPVNHAWDEDNNCYTYFDYSRDKIICNCNCDGQVAAIHDQSLASFYKSVQFKKPDEKKIRYFSLTIILSSLGLIGFFSFFLLIYDLLEDRQREKLNKSSEIKKVEFEYKQCRCLKGCGTFKFAWLITYFKNPFMNVFSIYNYDHPRYFRFFMQIFCCLLTLVLSILPYLFKKFKRKESAINNRSFAERNLSIHNIPALLMEKLFSFLYSVVSYIIVKIIFGIFSAILQFKSIRRKVWKPKKDILTNYIYNEVKKEYLVNEKWNLIRLRILSFSRICSWKLLEKKSKGKLANYSLLKQGFTSRKNYEEAKKGGSLVDMRASNIGKPNYNNDIVVPLIPPGQKDLLEENNPEEGIIQPSENKLCRCQGVKPFTLNKKGQSLLSISGLQKLQMIRNRYIYPIAAKQNGSKEKDTFEIEKTENYAFISLTNPKESGDGCRIFKAMIMDIILVFLLAVLYTIIFNLFTYVYQEYEGNLISAWLIPSIINITIVSFIINYGVNLIRAFMLIHFSGKRKNNCFMKLIFALFIEKYLVYLNKIRMLITKYPEDFPGASKKPKKPERKEPPEEIEAHSLNEDSNIN